MAASQTKDLKSLAGCGDDAPAGEFPFARAFVVQFVERAGASPTKFEGRVEHLETGHRGGFGDRNALLDFLVGMLAQISSRSDEEAESAEGKPRSRRRGSAT